MRGHDRRRRVTLTALLALGAVLASIVAPVASTAPAVAADATTFQPGYIISDDIFFNSTLMNEAQIQGFLESQETGCTAGPGDPGCMKDYRLSSAPRAADSWCGLYQGGSNELASHVLYNVAVACNINPQVLLVLLEKEESLVTATNPSAGRYRIATGYGCPDTAPCDSLYYGLFNQLYSAARQFQRYGDASLGFNYQAGRNNEIQWNPDPGCGTSTVFIENRATAALYNYTPYRPNLAALVNLYGTGDSCSSYGNRNFWRIFSDWFGSPIVSHAADSFVRAVYSDVLGRDPSDGERLNWGKAIMNGMPPSQVAGGFVNSDEFRLLKIDLAYREVLGREPEDSGRLSWLNGMRQGTLTPDDVYRIFMQSDEYYNSTGGTLDLFVAAVYQRIIKRPAVPDEVAYWSAMAQSQGRATVVNLIWFSVETSRTRVTDMYQTYLGHPPDFGGLVTWANLALTNGDSWVRSAIIGSGEYWARAQVRYP